MSSSFDSMSISATDEETLEHDLHLLNSTSDQVDPLSLRCLQEHNSTDMFEGKTKHKKQKRQETLKIRH